MAESSRQTQVPSRTTPPHPYKRHHRLLYRGSLSLPDSELLLDGIAFTARLPPDSPTSLLECPLALSLESMRGRPSLRFVSIVNLTYVNYECIGDINMFIHPRSLQTRSFFETVLCMDHVGDSGHTESAVRIGLGDGYGPDQSDLLVLGTLLPSQSILRMTVARVTSRSPDRVRKPRPDDPAPRKPPMLDLPRKSIFTKRRRTQDDAVRQGSQENIGNVQTKHLLTRETLYRLPATGLIRKDKGKARLNAAPSFKLPGLPIGLHEDDDVFGVQAVPTPSRSVDASGLETSNKTIVKKAAAKALAARGMPKEHPEFKELFGWVTRGVGFALRRKMKSVKMSRVETERLVDLHVLMYFDGFGGPSNSVN